MVSTNNAHESLFSCEVFVASERTDQPLRCSKALLVKNDDLFVWDFMCSHCNLIKTVCGRACMCGPVDL